jgi:hypothetical protein
LKSLLHNCKFTCNSFGVNTFSFKVTVDVAVKSQLAFAKSPSVNNLCNTVLYLTFGKIVIFPLDKVFPLNKAALTYFPEDSPEYELVILVVVAIVYLFYLLL